MVTQVNRIYLKVIAVVLLTTAIACQKKPVPKELEDDLDSVTTTTSLSTVPDTTTTTSTSTTTTTQPKYIYGVSGACTSGNAVTTFTTATASNLVFRINTYSGIRDAVLFDYNSLPSGDSPVGIADWSSTHVMVMLESASARRLELVEKKHSGARTSFVTSATVLSTALRNMIKTSDGGILLTRSGAVEKVSASGVRIGAPYVSNNLGTTCNTANTDYNSVTVTPNSRIILTHRAATPNNRLISVPATGAAGSCTAAQAAPSTTAWPTHVIHIPTKNKVFAFFANSTTALNQNVLMSYDYDDATGLFSNAQKIYEANLYPSTFNYLLYSVSAMAFDSETDTLYISTANSNTATVTNYQIEKFQVDFTKIGTDNNNVLQRSGTIPFYSYGLDTKCISQMFVGY